jgi:hypothetical protein
MARKKISTCAAKTQLSREGVDIETDFHALRSSDVDRVLRLARAARFYKRKNAPGSRARMFYERLQRVRCGI